MLKLAAALLLCATVANAAYTWDSCGTKLDRLKTTKLTETGALKAGSKITVVMTGATDLHVPLETGAWQIRVYETGAPKSTHTEVGDLMTALKFLDAKNTTFAMKISFTLPAKVAAGEFSTNIVATDQSKADYLCLDLKYAYSTEATVSEVEGVAKCTSDSQCPSSYCQNGVCHGCGDACCLEDKDCPGSYCANDPTKTPPYTCHGGNNNLFALVYGWAPAPAAATMGFVHEIVTSPGDHCLEVAFPGGTASPFWKSDGWKYGAPVRPEWKTGPCDTKKWTSVDSTEKDFDGWTAAKNAPDGGVVYTKYGYGVTPLVDAVTPLVDSVENVTCYYHEDTMTINDHKCLQACAQCAKFSIFPAQRPGVCPSKYNTVDKQVIQPQCPENRENPKYCPDTAINVTLTTKGQA